MFSKLSNANLSFSLGHSVGSFLILVFLLNDWMLLSVVDAAKQDQEDSPPVVASVSDGGRFLRLREEIRRVDKEINDLFVNMPIRFPNEQKEFVDRIDQLKDRQAGLRNQLDEAAIESFSADPVNNVQAGNHLGQMLIASLEGRGIERPFDPVRAIKLTKLFLDSGVSDANLYFYGYLAHFAIEEFDEAKRYLELFEQKTGTKEPTIRIGLQQMQEQWEREQELRAAEQEKGDLPRVRMTTDQGMIEIELFEDTLPNTVANFVSLIESGFYDGLTFFQVKPGQLARAGCPEHNGNGNPGYSIGKENPDQPRRFFAGTLGMYPDNTGKIGSQFFISYLPSPAFDANFQAFGRVIEGMDMVYQLKVSELSSDRPVTPEICSRILKMEVIRKRDHAYEPEKLGLAFELPKLPGLPGLNQPNETGGIPDVAPPKNVEK